MDEQRLCGVAGLSSGRRSACSEHQSKAADKQHFDIFQRTHWRLRSLKLCVISCAALTTTSACILLLWAVALHLCGGNNSQFQVLKWYWLRFLSQYMRLTGDAESRTSGCLLLCTLAAFCSPCWSLTDLSSLQTDYLNVMSAESTAASQILFLWTNCSVVYKIFCCVCCNVETIRIRVRILDRMTHIFFC